MTARGRFGLAALLAAVYAVCYSLIKLGLGYAPPLAFAALRALLGGAALLALLLLLGRPLAPPRRLWPGVIGLAGIGTLAGYGAMFSSPGRVGAGLAAVLGNTTPLIAMLLAVPLLDEPMTRRRALSLAVGLLGVVLIALPSLTTGTVAAGGDLVLPLVAAGAFAGASVLVKRLDVGEAVLPVAAWQLLLGGVALAAVASVAGPGAVIRWTPAFTGVLLFLAVVGTALTTALWYWLLQRDDVGRLSLALFLAPAMGLALGVVLFGERPAPVQWSGAIVIFASLAVVARERVRPAETSGRESVPRAARTAPDTG